LWTIRSIIVMGAVGITVAILRETGLMSRERREQLHPANSRPATALPIGVTVDGTTIAPEIPKKGAIPSISPERVELLLVAQM
jgi:hypothetical protein